MFLFFVVNVFVIHPEIISPDQHLDMYGSAFYDAQVTDSLNSAWGVLPLVAEHVKAQSVCDVGCGTGSWLKVWQDITGTKNSDVVGFDYEVPVKSLLINSSQYRNVDISQPFSHEKEFDLCFSLEVGEHLPETNSEDFVRSLTALAPVVLFSAAIPEQLGTNHVNCQWPAYWENLFKKYNYFAVDCIRSEIWRDQKICPYYKQNIFLFVREDRLSALGFSKSNEPVFPMVHPDLYLWALGAHKEPLQGDVKRLQRYAKRLQRYLFFSLLLIFLFMIHFSWQFFGKKKERLPL